ncbi:hypothetical protein VN12_02095 [Pirellula sp. SH-Sr6A]|nr:hypothetical protein VN12_02095 [Pirellula sp. SH-Sr6A]
MRRLSGCHGLHALHPPFAAVSHGPGDDVSHRSRRSTTWMASAQWIGQDSNLLHSTERSTPRQTRTPYANHQMPPVFTPPIRLAVSPTCHASETIWHPRPVPHCFTSQCGPESSVVSCLPITIFRHLRSLRSDPSSVSNLSVSSLKRGSLACSPLPSLTFGISTSGWLLRTSKPSLQFAFCIVF